MRGDENMKRTLTVTRRAGTTGGGYIGFLLDGVLIGKLKKTGESFTYQIDENAHNLEAVQFSVLGTRTAGSKSAFATIQAASVDCQVELFITTGFLRQSMNLAVSYGLPS